MKKIQPIVTPSLTSGSEPRPRWRILAALYTRNFRYLWMAQLTSAFVQRMGDVVMGWLILELNIPLEFSRKNNLIANFVSSLLFK